MRAKTLAAAFCALLALVSTLFLWNSVIGHNNDQNWQVLQSISGNVTIIDAPGYYGKWFGTVWTYPRTLEARFSDHKDDTEADESIKVTFNDGGTAQVSSYVRVHLPNTIDQRRILHRDFKASELNIKSAILAHLINCVNASGPVMSGSENQSSRKAEFNQIVEEQLANGLFKMRRTAIQLDDLAEIEEVGVDASGAKITREKKAVVQATQIVNGEDGKPIVIQPSPLVHYGLTILQFSITNIEPDGQTLAQFAAKKESYLNAERSKAQRQEEVQQRLMVEEKGRRQAAEIEAEENMKKTRALIQANQAAEVAVITKQQAVTVAQQKTEVAQQLKIEAESLREIAKISAQTAELEKQSTISRAEAKQKEIELGGGISEEKRVLAQINADRDVQVAASLSKVASPGVVILGGGGEGKSGSLTDTLMNLVLLTQTGIIKSPQQSATSSESK